MAYIYKIEVGDCLYIGSTTDMKERQRKHNIDLQRGCEYPIYKYCRENSINKLELIKLEYVDIENRFIVEQYYIDEFKTGHKLLNNRNAIFDKKEYTKAYCEANKEKLNEQNRAHYEANKDKIKEQHKSYDEANKDKISERKRKYYEKIKDKKKAHYEANKNKINERRKAYYQANKALKHQPEQQAPLEPSSLLIL